MSHSTVNSPGPSSHVLWFIAAKYLSEFTEGALVMYEHSMIQERKFVLYIGIEAFVTSPFLLVVLYFI